MGYDDRLFELLRNLSDQEMQTLWVDGLRNKVDSNEFESRSREGKIELISRDLRESAGHSIANTIRKLRQGKEHALPWKRVLIDVADKLRPGWRWTPLLLGDEVGEREIEQKILKYLDDRSKAEWDKLDDAKKTALVGDINAKIETEHKAVRAGVDRAAAVRVTRDGLGAALGAGLLTGGGFAALAGGGAGGLLGGLLGGLTTQIGLWLVLQFAGWTTGLRLAVGGGLGLIGLGAIAFPAVGVGVGLGIMGTSYRKTVPSVVLILASNQVHEMFQEHEDD